jgi:nucleoside-diphosphate-sugar epimerase
MNILITGSTGFLGKVFFHEIKKKYNVHTLNRNTGDYKCDLANDIPYLLEYYDIIIHCAGFAHKFQTNCSNFYKTNTLGMYNLLDGIKTSNFPKQIIYISSVSVYGLIKGDLIDENSPLLAKDAYGLSKIFAERILKEWCINNKVTYTILRLPLVIGDNPPGNLGSMISFIKKGFYFNIDGGKAKKSVVLASDLALNFPNFINKEGVFNLTDGYNPTFNEIANSIKKKFNSRVYFNLPKVFAIFLAKIGNMFGDNFPINEKKYFKIISNLTFNDEKARNVLNWKSKKAIDNF